MPEAEGAIQFAFDLKPGRGPGVQADVVEPLLAWRTVLRRLHLLGQSPERYGGLGYGNLSVRDPGRPGEFIVTASQTSGIEHLHADGLCRIREFDLERFWVAAEGLQPPSSESLTHAMIYDADPGVRWIFHAHSPDIRRQAEALGMPATGADVAYGSPPMACAVVRLLADRPQRPLVFVTLGHEDGVFACGSTAGETGSSLVDHLARSLRSAPALQAPDPREEDSQSARRDEQARHSTARQEAPSAQAAAVRNDRRHP